MNRNRIALFALMLLTIFNFTIPVVYAEKPVSEMSEEERNQKIKQEIERFKKEREKYKHPKVAEALVALEEAYKNGAEEAAKRFQAGEVLKDREGKNITSLEDAKKKGAEEAAEKVAANYDLKIKNGNKIRVHLILKIGMFADRFDKTVLASYGGEVGKGDGNILQADIPIDKIRKIAEEIDGITFITLPSRGHPESFQSEGVIKTGASNYLSSGVDGSIQDGSPNGVPVKIAVIDFYFYGLVQAKNNGDIPGGTVEVDCTLLTGCASTSFQSPPNPNQPAYQHGTAVAEVVHDMAPKAQLYLIEIDDHVDLKSAVTYCINNHIKVINFSGGFFDTNFFDGSAQYFDGICLYSNPVCSANDAYANGILFVKSMGNYATQHYKATYTDANGDGWHDTVLTIGNAQANSKIRVYLNWDAWGISNNDDYNVYLFDSYGGAIFASPDPSKPTGYLSWTVDVTGNYYLYIVKNNAAAPNRIFKVYSLNHDITQAVASSSLSSPADATGAIAVGAIDYRKWATGGQESYSSQGPTMDNRTKPDIAGPDGVTTYSYGQGLSSYYCDSSNPTGFCGTSAAAPHVAGAAALLLSKNPTYTVSQLWNSLTSSAITMGGSRPNYIYGYGKLNLPIIHKLDVSKSGTGFGTVSSSPSSISCGTDCIGGFDNNATVTLTATPDNSRSKFSLWSGNCSGSNSTCTLTMNTDKNVIAYFDGVPIIEVTPTSSDLGSIYGASNAFIITNSGLANLSITSISKSGTNSSDFNIPFTLDNCSGHTLVPYTSCSFTVELLPTSAGTKSATANILSNDPAHGTLSVPLTANIPYTYLISSTAGSGGTISPSTATVNFDGSQSFTITPDYAYHITDVKVDGVSISGYATSTNTSYSLTLSNTKASHTISATFSNTYKLTISKSGTGSGAVISTPSGISCGTGCSKSFTYATEVTLTASPYPDSTFIGWSGGGCSGTGSCTVTLTGDMTVTAIFTAPYIVTSEISAGGDYSVVLRNSGMLWVWGGNSYGQIGDGTTTDRLFPVQTGTGAEWVAVSAGILHTIAIRNDGSLWAWGDNTYGQLGDNTTISKMSPVRIGSDTDWISVSAGGYHTIALKNDGTLWTWGYNYYGQLGDASYTDRHSPVKIGTDTNWAAISAGNWHTVALKNDGTLWVWGANWVGQLGDGSTSYRPSPIKIGTDTDWAAISAGDSHTIALKANKTLWAWGYNGDGELGDNTTTDRHSPIRIGSDSNWSAISAGDWHNIALKTGGTLWSWGYNYDGELGNGTTTDGWAPVQISAGNTWKTVSAGPLHNIAVKSDGTLWAWGANWYGQIGDGTTIDRHSPVQINFQTYNITALADSGGVISPSGSVTVTQGGNQTFTVTPNTGYHITAITGCGGTLTGNTYTTGSITADCSVTAGFAINTYTVTPSVGTGGSINPATPQSANHGSTTSFTVTPNTGYHIASVTGCGGTLNGNTYTTGAITADCSITATFAINTYTLTIAKAGTNSGTVATSPSGISCGTTCAGSFNYGTLVTLTATPDANSSFTGWSGGGCSGTGTCTVTMNADTTVTASFGCANSPVRILGKAGYPILQAAYDAAVDGDTIQSHAVTFTENVTTNRNISVTIDGGYTCDYSSNTGSTALKGMMTINSGTVTVKNLNLQF